MVMLMEGPMARWALGMAEQLNALGCAANDSRADGGGRETEPLP
jgi:hypothetical protein